jgi:ribokinase
MSILNFGSCCIDNVYAVPHFAQPGETLPCYSYEVHPGGKGLNQSIALAASGAAVRHAGRVGTDGQWLVDLLREHKVDTSFIQIGDGPSGHANIQVTPEGENSIVLFGGANQNITPEDVDLVINSATEGEFLLVQNETSSLSNLIEQAAKKGLRIVFNAAPMTSAVNSLPLSSIELLIINETEGAELTGRTAPEEITDTLLSNYQELKVLLTLGAEGALFADSGNRIKQPALKVNAIDTTGAGDTFTGFFLAHYSRDHSIEDCLKVATKAASICVTRKGAATSIPELSELG